PQPAPWDTISDKKNARESRRRKRRRLPRVRRPCAATPSRSFFAQTEDQPLHRNARRMVARFEAEIGLVDELQVARELLRGEALRLGDGVIGRLRVRQYAHGLFRHVA